MTPYRTLVAAAAALCFVLLGPGHTSAQTVFGEVELNGKKIQLMSDGTWKVKPSETPVCAKLNTKLSYCLAPIDWVRKRSAPDNVLAAFVNGTDFSAEIRQFNAGSDDGVTDEDIRKLLIETARTKESKQSFEVVESGADVISDLPARYMVLRTIADDTSVSISATYVILKYRTMVVETRAKDAMLYHDDHRALHVKLVAGVKIDE